MDESSWQRGQRGQLLLSAQQHFPLSLEPPSHHCRRQIAQTDSQNISCRIWVPFWVSCPTMLTKWESASQDQGFHQNPKRVSLWLGRNTHKTLSSRPPPSSMNTSVASGSVVLTSNLSNSCRLAFLFVITFPTWPANNNEIRVKTQGLWAIPSDLDFTQRGKCLFSFLCKFDGGTVA